jgi:integrase
MLTNAKCNKAAPKGKPYKLADSGGLYLLITTTGSKLWRIKYRYMGKEKLLSLGPYPLTTLLEARENRDIAKKALSQGQDPSTQRKDHKRRAVRNAHNTFKAVALEWYDKKQKGWSESHRLRVKRLMELDIFPYIGARPIAEIDAPELLDNVLRRIEKRGSLEVASKVKQTCGMVFRYGIATGKCSRDHSADLKGALEVKKTTHYPALDIKEMPEFLTALKENKARLYPRTQRAIKLLMLTFVRTSELIHAKWSEFDLENAQWEIPAERMKMGNPHIVPLSTQVLALLEEQQEETGGLNTEYVLPGFVNHKQPLSNNTILFAIGNLGFKGRMTGHGFRALAMSTIKEKLGYRHEVVDRQLAHAHKSKIDRAYDRAQFLDEREEMMQKYADYIEAIGKGSKVKSKIKPSKHGKRHAVGR